VDKIDGEDVEEHIDEKLKENPICTNGLSSTRAWNPKEKMSHGAALGMRYASSRTFADKVVEIVTDCSERRTRLRMGGLQARR
jgi:hypothetical protein